MAVLRGRAWGLSGSGQARLMRALTPGELGFWTRDWPEWTHDGQREPEGEWRTWVMKAGRGFGKTRAGAEWVSRIARSGEVRIALVAATVDEARAVMVEGPSGLLAVADPRARPHWEPSLKRLRWKSGAEAFLYSGASPETLRGPEHHIAWCDELAKWRHPQKTWDMLQLGLRLRLPAGSGAPRALVTTTPRPGPALTRIMAGKRAVTTGGTTWGNPHLSEAFIEQVEEQYAGTRLGRQELAGEVLSDVEGALWTEAGIEGMRTAPFCSPSRLRGGVGGGSLESTVQGPPPAPPGSPGGELARVVVGVDPPASAAGTCGIVVCGARADGVGLVLEDRSAGGLSPEGWARAVAAAVRDWDADRVIAEANQGGDMVRSVLHAADARLGVTLVRASRGKAVRAEPVATLFERGAAKFAGRFPALEAELQGLTAAGGYEGPGGSPDRADAMVWALWALLIEPRREPSVRRL